MSNLNTDTFDFAIDDIVPRAPEEGKNDKETIANLMDYCQRLSTAFGDYIHHANQNMNPDGVLNNLNANAVIKLNGSVISMSYTELTDGEDLFDTAVDDLDDVDDGTTYSRVLTTDISAGHIKLSETVGDLDDIDDGTYGKVLTTDIRSGRIKLTRLVQDDGSATNVDPNATLGASWTTNLSNVPDRFGDSTPSNGDGDQLILTASYMGFWSDTVDDYTVYVTNTGIFYAGDGTDPATDSGSYLYFTPSGGGVSKIRASNVFIGDANDYFDTNNSDPFNGPKIKLGSAVWETTIDDFGITTELIDSEVFVVTDAADSNDSSFYASSSASMVYTFFGRTPLGGHAAPYSGLQYTYNQSTTAVTFALYDCDLDTNCTFAGTWSDGNIPALNASKITAGALAVARGGTNISSYAVGDILYASGTTTLSKLAKGTANQVLAMNSGATAPEWQTPLRWTAGSYIIGSGESDDEVISLGTGNAAKSVTIKREDDNKYAAHAYWDGTNMINHTYGDNSNPTENTPIKQHANGFEVLDGFPRVNPSSPGGDRTFHYEAFY